jgi:phosphoglycerate kinase
MKYGINTLDDFEFYRKTVLCRLDLNSPYNREDNKLRDVTRIEAAIPTIRELSDKGAKMVLISHQGGDLEYQNFISTELHSKVISSMLGKEIKFLDDVCGPEARRKIKDLREGDILLLDNVRYMAEEMTLFETKLKLSAEEQTKTIVINKLAPYADIYICDAFAASHRDQPTLVAFEHLLPSAMGRLFEKEYETLSKIMDRPCKPCVFFLGGAKIEDAFLMMPTVLSKGIADKIISSGLLASVFYISSGIDLGRASTDFIYKKKLNEYIPTAKKLLKKYKDKIILPLDFAYIKEGKRIELDVTSLPIDNLIVDIGQKTIKKYKDIISRSKTIFINGPAGIFEEKESEIGTKEIWVHIANSNSYSVIGGGDSIAAVNKYGLGNGFSHICTGGGAMVRFLSGEELPVIKALKYSAIKFNKKSI